MYLTSCWQSDGLQTAVLSENDLLACCGFECGDGCEGGYPIRAWQYFKRTGVVTDKVCHHTLNPKPKQPSIVDLFFLFIQILVAILLMLLVDFTFRVFVMHSEV